MKLLLDENLSRRIVPLIAAAYPSSSQVALLGLERVSDADIWVYARQHDFVIVTKDSDFGDLAIVNGAPPKLIWLKTGNQTWRATAQLLIDQRDMLATVFMTMTVVCLD